MLQWKLKMEVASLLGSRRVDQIDDQTVTVHVQYVRTRHDFSDAYNDGNARIMSVPRSLRKRQPFLNVYLALHYFFNKLPFLDICLTGKFQLPEAWCISDTM